MGNHVQSSTIMPQPPKNKKAQIYRVFLGFIGGQGRDRTGDTRIFSPLLYQLSYLATAFSKMVGAQGFEPWTQ